MRTRLDEIVEEIHSKTSAYHSRAVGMVIAERAFRHGVEQEAARCLESHRGPQVQSAPAEEKDSCCWKHAEGGSSCGDRRKGERRKGLEICLHVDLPGRCFVFTRPNGTIYHAGDSRHRDRRK